MELLAKMYPDMSQEKRIKLMTKQALRVEVIDYAKPLTEDEIVAENQKYSREAMALDALEAEKKKTIAVFTEKIKAIKGIMAQRLIVVKNEKRDVQGKTWLFADQIGGKMNSYDKDGVCVVSRPLYEDEKKNQLYIGDNTDQISQGEPNGHDNEEIQDAVVVEETAKGKGKKLSKKATEAAAKALIPESPVDEIAAEETERRKNQTKPQRAESATEKKIKQMTGNRKKIKEKVLAAEAAEANMDSPSPEAVENNIPIQELPPLDESDLDQSSDLPDPNA